jgi:hypothetical protein
MWGKVMKKVFLVIGIIVGLVVLSPLLALGVYSLDLFYYEANNEKAQKAAIEFLEKKYKERFKVEEVEYSKALGDDEGYYTLQVTPLENPEITISVDTTEDYQVTTDNYKESEWTEQFRKEMVSQITPIFQGAGKIYAYGSFPEEIVEKYVLEDSYHTIYSANPHQSFERIHIVSFNDSFEKEDELKKIYQLWELTKDRKFKDNSIEVNYYPKELSKELGTNSDLNQFENEHQEEMFHFCRFSNEQAQNKPITSPEDFEAFCRKLR